MNPKLTVELAERSYPIYLGHDLAAPLRAALLEVRKAGRPVAVIADGALRHAQPEYAASVFDGFPVLELPPGEKAKSFREMERICEFLASAPLDRSGLVVAFGGGVTGDCAGFAAASFLRGVELCMVPSTLLSMVDSSVGGKTGINLAVGKNLVGAFHQPSAVWIDTALLETLPDREFSAGMAEVIKYGLLGHRELFLKLESEPALHPKHPFLSGAIETCCAQKAAIVQADERETAGTGGRALLNLGHTFGHAIEAVAGYGEYLHGEAVAIGMVLAARLSARQGRLPSEDATRIEHLLQRYQLPTALRTPLPVSNLLDTMRRDKKVRRGKLRLVLLQSIGEAITVDGVAEEEISKVWLSAGARS